MPRIGVPEAAREVYGGSFAFDLVPYLLRECGPNESDVRLFASGYCSHLLVGMAFVHHAIEKRVFKRHLLMVAGEASHNDPIEAVNNICWCSFHLEKHIHARCSCAGFP